VTRDHELDELLGAYALDAVSDVERRRIEAYLALTPEAEAEVSALRQAASMLAAEPSRPVPEVVWDRIAGTLRDRPRTAQPAFGRPRRRGLVPTLVAAAAVIIAVAGLVVALTNRGDETRQAEDSIEEAYDAARSDPDGRHVSLASEDAALTADAVIGAEGIGYVSAASLPQLPVEETYQLWGVYADGDVISLGVIGNRPDIEPFTAAGDVTTLVITREVAGGVMASTSGALLVGEVEA
jgi:hypothetical protein